MTKCDQKIASLDFERLLTLGSFAGVRICLGPGQTRDARAQLTRDPCGVERALHRQQRGARQHRNRPRDGDAQGEVPLPAQGRRGDPGQDSQGFSRSHQHRSPRQGEVLPNLRQAIRNKRRARRAFADALG